MRRLLVLLSLLGPVAVLAGCGDGDNPKPGPVASPARAAPEDPAGMPAIATPAEEWDNALGTFLQKGPRHGTWRVWGPGQRSTWHFEPNPVRPGEVLGARVQDDGETLYEVSSISRLGTPLVFYKAPAWLFMKRYERHGEPEHVQLADGEPAVRVEYRPTLHSGYLTARVVWFSPTDASVLQIEDKQRTGVPIRTVRRVLDSKVKIDVSELVLKVGPCCPTIPNVAANDIDRLAEAPFPIFRPTYKPAGYKRIRVDYEERELSEQGPEIQRATLLYSDGMGLISVAVAPSDHMDAIVRHYSRMPEAQEGEGDGCAESPRPPKDLVRKKGQIRMHSGPCRTVLRLDEVAEGISVMIIGHNEVAREHYVQMIESLDRIPE